MSRLQQLTLDVHLREEATFVNYCVGDNTLLCRRLEAISSTLQPPEPIVIWGRSGVGRTHLLQAICHSVHQRGQPVAYLPLAERTRFSPDITQGMEMMRVVCWDDVHKISGVLEWEQALFHAYNRIQEKGGILCISAAKPIKQLKFALPDLASRLLSCLAFEIKPLSDANKLIVLQQRAKARGLELPERVGVYLLRHHARDMKELVRLLDVLDKASLATQRHLTLPLLKKTLNDLS